MVTKFIFTCLVFLNISVFQVLVYQLSNFPPLHFIINVLIFRIIFKSVYYRTGKCFSSKNRAISKHSSKQKYHKHRILSYIFIIIISLHLSNFNKSTIKKFKQFQQKSITINLIYLKISLFENQRSYSLYLQKSRNKLCHSKYGNRTKTFGLKLLHLNKGNSYFKNKINDIQITIDKFLPDIISISEANLFKNDNLSVNQFSGYNFIYDNFWDTIGWSRQILMIKKDIDYIRRSDLENINQAIIWIEIPLMKSNNLLIAGGYRQWKLPKEVNFPNSGSPNNQKLRWDAFLKKYQLALNEGKDICTLMDDNINTLFNADLSNRTHILDMKESFENFSNDNNIAFLNDEPTRFISGCDPSCIDHLTTNCPDKFFNTNTVKTNISDHCCLVSNYKNKKIKYHPKKI